VGSLFAAHLAQLDDVEVWAYDVSEPHVAAINRDGLRLVGLRECVVKLEATTDASELPPLDFGIVATKGMFTRPAIEAAAHAFRDGAVCSVQNGVGNEEIIAEHVARVIRGTTFPAGRVLEPGVVRFDTGGKTWIGPFEPQPAGMDEVCSLADTLSRSGMETEALPDARGAQWTKLIFNATSNGITALTGLTHGRACMHPDVRWLMDRVIEEGKQVAAALGVTMERDPAALLADTIEAAYEHRPSMLEDVAARRQTEIEMINGGICRFGDEVDVPTPYNRAVRALVLGIEASWQQDASPQRDASPHQEE
jgi:2-dehydropantoate 2-reductase